MALARGLVSVALLGVLAGTSIAQDAPPKRVELILDASGSMMGRLPSGTARITTAKSAVDKLVGGLPDDLEVAFRVYGHQSHRSKRDCTDTQLLVPFAPLAENRAKIRAALPALVAQGFTPISFVLGEAAGDFPDPAGENIIILVSDGKETCKGDPCLLARQLRARQARLVIHTVGLGVDEATRDQLRCIAKEAGGAHFDVHDVESLWAGLAEAVRTPGGATPVTGGVGKLQILKADIRGHRVIDADTGEVVGSAISHVQDTVTLPAGLYNVTVGPVMWKSVAVEGGQTTVLRPGRLSVANAWGRGHKVLEAETGQDHGSLSSSHAAITLMPGEYLVTFGSAVWPVRLAAGEQVELRPGVVVVEGAHYRGHPIRTPDGERVGSLSNTGSSMPLPPGDYTIEIDGQVTPFTLREGERRIFSR